MIDGINEKAITN